MLQEAIWSERKLRFTYQRGPVVMTWNAKSIRWGWWRREVRGISWRVLGRVCVVIAFRAWSRADVLDQTCTVPAGFDLAAYWEQSTTTFKSAPPNYIAKFSVEPDVFLRLRFAGRFARVGDRFDHGSGRMVARSRWGLMLKRWRLSMRSRIWIETGSA